MRSSFPTNAVFAALAIVATTATTAAAQITPGSTLTFTGTANATDVGLPGVILDFNPRVTAGPSGNTGAFAFLNRTGSVGQPGQIADLRVGNGFEYIPNFLTFGGYRFTLGYLPSGPYGQASCYIDPVPGQTCTPFQSVQGNPSVNAGLSPFYVKNVASGDPNAPINSTASFDLIGTVTAPGGATSLFTGTITSSFVGLPYQYVLYTLEQQGLQGLMFTGTFVAGPQLSGGARDDALLGEMLADAGAPSAVVPEPGTYALVTAGLLGVAGFARRRRAA